MRLNRDNKKRDRDGRERERFIVGDRRVEMISNKRKRQQEEKKVLQYCRVASARIS